MENIINIIKEFFKRIFFKTKILLLDAPKYDEQIENEKPLNEIVNDKEEDKKFFEIYDKVKNGQYNLEDLTNKQCEKIISILKIEILLKKDKLDIATNELSKLKNKGAEAEKNRILELYKQVKDKTIEISSINKQDLLKIKDLIIEHSEQ